MSLQFQARFLNDILYFKKNILIKTSCITKRCTGCFFTVKQRLKLLVKRLQTPIKTIVNS